MARDRWGAVWGGLGLIGLGIALILANVVGWERIWPIFPLFGGLAFIVGYVATGFQDGGLAFVGSAATLLGLFFFGFTVGIWEWSDMARLWPVLPLIGGLAFIVLFVAERRTRDLGTLAVGCAAIIVGVAGLAVTYGFLGSDIVNLWPLIIILIGFVSLIGALVQWSRTWRE